MSDIFTSLSVSAVFSAVYELRMALNPCKTWKYTKDIKEFADKKLNLLQMVGRKGTQHGGNRTKCWLPAFSHFPQSKAHVAQSISYMVKERSLAWPIFFSRGLIIYTIATRLILCQTTDF